MLEPGEFDASFEQLFNNPLFRSYTNNLYPRTMEEAFHWGAWIRGHHGDFLNAIARAIAYFMNGLDITGELGNADRHQQYEKILMQEHNLMGKMTDIALDLKVFGNSFTSVVRPFIRSLECPECHISVRISHLESQTDYKFTDGAFQGKCVKCGKQVMYNCKDPADDTQPLHLIRWNPLFVELDHCPFVNVNQIRYNPSAMDKAFLEQHSDGQAIFEYMPLHLLKALSEGKQIIFNKDECKHLKYSTDAISATVYKGYGMPGFLPSFKYVVMMMLLENQTEAVIRDFIMPLRLLYPKVMNGGSDNIGGAVSALPKANLASHLKSVIQKHSMNNASWHLMPQPVDALNIGGDAKALLYVDLLQYVKEQLLDTLGVPSELYKTSLFPQMGGQALSSRLFERYWRSSTDQLNDWLRWYVGRCQTYLRWPEMDVRLLQESSTADPAKMQMMSQLFQAGKISWFTFARQLNIDPVFEKRKAQEEALADAEDQSEISDKMATIQEVQVGSAPGQSQQQQPMGDPSGGQAAGGGAPQGGAPGGTPMAPALGGDPIAMMQSFTVPEPTLDMLENDSSQIAEMMKSMQPYQRRQIYDEVRQKQPALHALLLQKVQQNDYQAGRQGIEAQRSGQEA